MKVLNFGSLNSDLVYRVPYTVRPGETLSSSSFTMNAGGKGANQSAALAKAGVSVFHAGKIGSDGTWILEKLQRFGVNTEFVTVGSGKTGHAVIQVSDNGENAIVLYGGGNVRITREEIDAVFHHFDKGDYLLLQNEINNIEYIMRSAAEKKMKIFFNPAPYNEKITTYPLHTVDVFFVNETEGYGLSGGGDTPFEIMDRLTKKYRGKDIVLTLGKDGVLFGRNDFRASADVVDVPVADTTAAGDTFIGYYIAGMFQGKPVEELLKVSCAASSLSVSKEGAMDSIPFRSEVNPFL